MWVDIGWILLGFVLLAAGADGLVRGGAGLALRLGLSPLVVGLTVVAFGTSAPELIVSVRASLTGDGGIAVGNVVGSNIANIGLILGISALISPIKVDAKVFRMEIPVMVLASVLVGFMLLDGGIERIEGAGLVGGVIIFAAGSVWLAKRERKEIKQEYEAATPDSLKTRPVWLDLVFLFAGLGLLAVGADVFVMGAVNIAAALNVSKVVIGLTIVSVGTSLPELATSIVAAIRGQSDIALGNVIGSNVFNVFGILGAAALVSPLDGAGITAVDVGVMAILGVGLFPLLRSNLGLSRFEAGLLFAIYVGYLVWLVVTATGAVPAA